MKLSLLARCGASVIQMPSRTSVSSCVFAITLLMGGTATPAFASEGPTENIVVARKIDGGIRIETHDVPVGSLEQRLQAFSAESRVLAAERNGTYRAFGDPLESAQYYLDRPTASTGFHAASPLVGAASRTGIIVAVVDSGVQASHPYLGGSVLPGTDFVGGTDGRTDPLGHGTFVASMIASPAGDGIGIAGAASGVKILPVRALNENGEGTFAQIASAISWADAAGADVINLSLGGGTYSSVMETVVHQAVNHGRILVAGAGNDGISDLTYPAAFPEVVAVGGTTGAGTIWEYSNYGEWITVVAPATDIIGAGIGSGEFPCSPMCTADGTSFSAPLVSSIAALARAVRPGMTPAAFKALIAATADADSSYGTGAGSANPYHALLALVDPSNPSAYQPVAEQSTRFGLRSAASNPNGGGYALNRSGTVTSSGGAPMFGTPNFGFDAARDIAVMPDGLGYIVLDMFGGVHMFGSAIALRGLGNPYWVGWDIARAIAITPDGKGYAILDGWGGLHSYGSIAATPYRSLYWPGWDIARDVSIASNGEAYVLDGWGGIHGGNPAAQAVINACGATYWPGWDIGRRITAFPGGYSVLDGYGGIRSFCSAPPPPAGFYFTAFAYMGFGYSNRTGWIGAAFDGNVRRG